MPRKMTVLVASRSKEAMAKVATELDANSNYKVAIRHVENGHADPVYGLSFVPDVVVNLLTDRGHSDLEALGNEISAGSPPLIVAAENGDANTMRLAMRAGARDFLCGHFEIEDLVETIDRIACQLDGGAESEENLTLFVNAKGGSGATFVASNVAHILTTVSDVSTAMLSLDVQFGGISQYFDTELRHGLMDVLNSVESLDDVALDAYMTQHESGLRLISARPESKIQCHSDRAGQLGMLVEKMMSRYEHVIVDMPRRIDPYFIPVIERATRTVLVLQQTLGHLQDGARMLEIFQNYGIAPTDVVTVVNRYDKNSPISIDDIKRSIKGTEIALLPSDFKTVSESINLGMPIHEHSRGSSVTKALLALETKIGGSSAERKTGIFSRAFGNLLRTDKWSQAQKH
jgi:pilus assembly protein CpaE